ncbi:uncharacterized protein LOC119186919 [Rhipicephalus microplus]|uniref:uncharacterized protein LOC119186919 n=1 Tax=Rhipicephalus microplus TaxID=6941 RepID=UPI003F6B5D8C
MCLRSVLHQCVLSVLIIAKVHHPEDWTCGFILWSTRSEIARPLQFMQPSLHASPPSPPPPSPPPLWPCSPLSPQGWSATQPLPPPQRLLLPEPPSPSSEQPRPLMLPVPHPGTTSSGSQEPTSQGMGSSDELPLFSQVDNQIHLENGIFLEQEKWAWLLSRPRDSLFCKEATKFLWGVSALHKRSITGAPYRRYVRSGNQAPPRRALTPKKLEAVGNAFSKYIAERPSEVAAIERLRKMNRFIAEMLNDLNK